MDHLADRLPGKTISVLECPMSTVTFRKAVRHIITWGQTPQDTQPRVVLLRDAHGVLQGRHDRQIRHLERTADLVLPRRNADCLVASTGWNFIGTPHLWARPTTCRMPRNIPKKIRHGFLGEVLVSKMHLHAPFLILTLKFSLRPLPTDVLLIANSFAASMR